MNRHPPTLETLTLDGLPEEAVPAFEAALQTVCPSVGYFKDDATDTWRLEAVRETGSGDDELLPALVLAAALSGIEPPELQRAPVEAEGWLARTLQSFPEQEIGARVLIRPTHLPNPPTYGRIVLRLDAGLAFGSGEHLRAPSEVLETLRASDVEAAREAADLLTQRSPLSVAATVEAMRRAAGMDSVHEVLAEDMVLARGLIEHGDFVEGVRAQLVDTDRQPMWSQAAFDEVSDADVARLFEG